MKIESKEIRLQDGRQVELRSPLSDDAALMIAYLKAMYSETDYMGRYPEECRFTIEDEEKLLTRILESDNEVMIAVFDQKRIIGNVSLYCIYSGVKGRHRSGMGIGILQDYQQLGLGNMLMNMIIQEGKNMGYEQIELDVVSENKKAVNLYQKHGFEITGTKPHAMKLKNGDYFDEFSMVLFL